MAKFSKTDVIITETRNGKGYIVRSMDTEVPMWFPIDLGKDRIEEIIKNKEFTGEPSRDGKLLFFSDLAERSEKLQVTVTELDAAAAAIEEMWE